MTQTIAYEVMGQDGEVEFRRYPPLVLATVNDSGDDRGFQHLFAFINGANRARREIPMTAPVITAEHLAMTAPMITAPGSMSFVMPPGMKPGEVPEPTDEKVRIEAVPARVLAVVRFSGHAGREDVEAARSRLLATLERGSVPTKGEPFLMRYNAPMTPGFLRRNEVAFEVDPDVAANVV
ncbi:MAG TPA: heme-binding protein [Methanoregulaceae archaeon]|nr:heme-binding protein [Methanoregulaceae archaeon]HQJ88613.1 heme-binding protein [Methanoregulaceae archaeon]